MMAAPGDDVTRSFAAVAGPIPAATEAASVSTNGRPVAAVAAAVTIPPAPAPNEANVIQRTYVLATSDSDTVFGALRGNCAAAETGVSAVATAPAEEVSDGSTQGTGKPYESLTSTDPAQQRLLTAVPLHQESQIHRIVDKDSPYAGPGPAAEFPIDHIYRCFDQQNGLLFRLVNDKRHLWAFYNDTTDYVMRVTVTFGPESSISALGKTRLTVLNEDTGECRLVLDVAPGETQRFMRGEYNGFITCYDASPIECSTDADAEAKLPRS
ncbi:hypothetical protein LSCM1_06465 [Leishmania martiniquensis]|uniref:DUF1935 domain-containing protein n=1 Tax=Leishmania martiniquensis TaxID=1580590 RepID=A0A836HNX2_9TRYP|nr:hypothetical protein LSCM1_06465 [Leishmania martiniquensis]